MGLACCPPPFLPGTTPTTHRPRGLLESDAGWGPPLACQSPSYGLQGPTGQVPLLIPFRSAPPRPLLRGSIAPRNRAPRTAPGRAPALRLSGAPARVPPESPPSFLERPEVPAARGGASCGRGARLRLRGVGVRRAAWGWLRGVLGPPSCRRRPIPPSRAGRSCGRDSGRSVRGQVMQLQRGAGRFPVLKLRRRRPPGERSDGGCWRRAARGPWSAAPAAPAEGPGPPSAAGAPGTPRCPLPPQSSFLGPQMLTVGPHV